MVDPDEAMRAFVQRARAAWPAIPLDDGVFRAHAAARIPPGADLAGVSAGDLYLACACARGEPRALAELEAGFIGRIPALLGRLGGPPDFDEEVKQAARIRLLVGEGGSPPRIARYDGRVPLAVWLKVVVTRLAVNLRAGARPHRPLQAEPVRAPGPDPEIALLKKHYAPEFRAAIDDALAALSPRQANLLRFHFLDGMSADAIGRLYRVSGRTVQRWIAGAREEILARTRARLADRLGLAASVLDSVMGLVESQLTVSLQEIPSKNRS